MIDHLVYATPDLEGTVRFLQHTFDIDLVEGGPHVGRGTRNFLAGLGGSTYLEVIGPDPEQRSPNEPRPFGVDEIESPQLVAWCARPAAPLETVVRNALKAGFNLGSVHSMSRRRPDRLLLEWELTVRPGTPHLIVPFCISWGSTPHPTTTLTHTTTLTRLDLFDPNPDQFNTVLESMGELPTVTLGDTAIGALLSTPNGPLLLERNS
jgi:hypothetical protein